ncbi:hypothetical protein EIP86_001898 [Pleurotus ostreatoroseus]|nr:hypothetical protein EIP86_001898 [Pleurotus ostreatoroseus]
MAAIALANATEPVSVPIYKTTDQYPTGPIPTFPPPVPHIHKRQPLHARRGVAMSVQIPRNPLSSPTVSQGPWSAKGHIQPHRSHLPRRRNPKRITMVTRDLDTPEELKPAVVEIPEPVHDEAPAEDVIDISCYAPNAPTDDPSAQEVVERLYIAFATGDEALEELPKPEGLTEAYTHVVSIVYGDGKASTEHTSDIRIQRLRLILPVEAREARPRAGLMLTDAQLRAVRDFVAQALPHPSTRILITAPLGRPTDVMCAVMCSLALTTEKEVEALMDEVETEDMLSVWKGEICGDEVERIQKIAKAWSWTQAVPALPSMD